MKEEQIRLLKEESGRLAELKAQLSIIQEENRNNFERDNAHLMTRLQEVEAEVNVIKEEVKLSALEDFKETGEKKLLGGIGIRIFMKLDYSEDAALKWAKENMQVAIKQAIDKRKFENFAKTAELDFVTVRQSTTVTFPKEIKI